MSDFTITERTEPFTLEEVFNFIDDTNISKADAHELKSRIADVVQAERNKVVDDFVDKAWELLGAEDEDIYTRETIREIAEQMKEGA